MPDDQDDVIKNPNRNETTPYVIVPEHVRLGVTPVYKNFPSLDGNPIVENDSHIMDNNEHINYGFNIKSTSIPKTKSPIGDFVLMVNGKVINHGKHDFILSQAKAILYGEHPDFLDKNIQIEDVVILKRMTLKVGVFFDE